MRSSSSFESMGCNVVVAGASAAELAGIRALFEERDAIFSRFRPDSELNRVNAAAGRAVLVSLVFAHAVEAALWAVRATGGLVDPTLGAAVEAAGYDRDFAALAPDPRQPGLPVPARPGAVRLFGRVLSLGRDVRLDLNGVVKAAAVDDALGLVSGPGFVSAGGDLAACGDVDVALRGGEAVRLVSGGLATSGRTRRRWLRGGEEQHHLGAVVVLLLALGPLRFAPRPWNARSFDGTLTGHVLRDVGATRGLVSAAATADGKQRGLSQGNAFSGRVRVHA